MDRYGVAVGFRTARSRRWIAGPASGGECGGCVGSLDALQGAGIAAVSSEQRAAAFAAARWPGRMELISRRGSTECAARWRAQPARHQRPRRRARRACASAFVRAADRAHWRPGQPLAAGMVRSARPPSFCDRDRHDRARITQLAGPGQARGPAWGRAHAQSQIRPRPSTWR